MEPQIHPDPFGEAARRALQRTIQIASSAATGAQILVHLRANQARLAAEQQEQVRREQLAQARADRAAALASWAPGLDPNWLRQADLIQIARIWGAAAPYADPADPWSESSAAIVVQRCEDRLRVLHPYAMRRYDANRSQGQALVEAMREAAPFFAYAPNPRDPDWQPRLAVSIAAGARPDLAAVPAARAGQHPWQQDFPVDIRVGLEQSRAAETNQQAGAARTPTPASDGFNLPASAHARPTFSYASRCSLSAASHFCRSASSASSQSPE